ncbi:MAG: tRNA (N6-threonylcarbamoyladenosine(37)-N6)-methyltransferase TrmO [Proteobacteria bacterium]|nr:tRNA (N6-threonylcarbamoyladenosine(37)-N6)-methyltransferase TrmO [Pseudomonadota bacterium]MBU1569414.1 tRNA (N6-threonylcarbamoyladenosine(37)-N6)-methyltransferase TrmO [Pseudomonadota bacterium]
MDEKIIYSPIGIIHTPFTEAKKMPIQPAAAKGIEGTIDIKPEFENGLKYLDGFSHIILLYHLHLSKGFSLEVIPFLDDKPRGVFATRAPRRPNPIGLSIVRLVDIKKNRLNIRNVDVVDGTPLLDIKPYVPEFDDQKAEKIGWLSDKIDRMREIKSDERFK